MNEITWACLIAAGAIAYLAGPPQALGNYLSPESLGGAHAVIVPGLICGFSYLLQGAFRVFDSGLLSLTMAALYEAGAPAVLGLESEQFGLHIALFLGALVLILIAYEGTSHPSVISTLFLGLVVFLYGELTPTRLGTWLGVDDEFWFRAIRTAIVIGCVVFNYFMLRMSYLMSPEQKRTLANTIRLVIYIVSVSQVIKGQLSMHCGFLLMLPNIIWLFALLWG